MLSRKEKPFTFGDAALIHTERQWKTHWLFKVQKILNWKNCTLPPRDVLPGIRWCSSAAYY
jgi:hypothetical protein